MLCEELKPSKAPCLCHLVVSFHLPLKETLVKQLSAARSGKTGECVQGCLRCCFWTPGEMSEETGLTFVESLPGNIMLETIMHSILKIL